MGIGSGVVGFGLGYAAGMKIGDRPIRAARQTAEDARRRMESLRESTNRIRAKVTAGGGPTIDIRHVRDVMTSVPETISLTASLRDAAALMDRADVGDVIVVQDDEVRGILTDRDIVLRAVASDGNTSTMLVSDVFSPGAVTIAPDATVQEAVELMRENDLRRLPVVELGRPVGVISIGDVAVAREPTSLLSKITTAPPNN